ncbi:DUF389 domain-containing protein [Demequina sp. B12]|uniref:DUF389 domain-containing protein n=1 Tax=Demequina sp. B12 TaxID=2992757 RepID=UPI00237A32D2|nr:DUF389 domain-containing protein [Demequina sp. B12]MDE0573634.1 DUF389 domain-containing protein [Demequina sp. B12]
MSPDRSKAEDALIARMRKGSAAIANPASLKGLIATITGAIILLLPDLATLALSTIAFVAIALNGVLDIVFALRGKARQRKSRNRFWSLLRGLISLVFATFLAIVTLVEPTGAGLSLAIIVGFLGIYLAIRGAVVVVRALTNRDIDHKGVRITGGITAIAIGVLAERAPFQVTNALISGVAVAAIVLGLLLVTRGLRRAEGDVPTTADPSTDDIPTVLWDWIKNSDIGQEHRRELAQTLYYESPGRLSKRSAWWVMLVLSVAIATFAVLADSTAVVIGAMLVAPLMSPILGLAGAIVNGWKRRALDSALLVGLGVAVSIALSYGLAAWAPVAVAIDTNTQIVSRVNPAIVDMLIALAAGAAGAFATVDKRVSGSIAGVAIAVALVPPLSVVGVCLGAGRIEDASGAFLLFLTNFVAIVLAACAVFVLTGFARPAALQHRASGILTTVIPFVALAAVILVPLMFTSQGLLKTASLQTVSQRVVDEWLGEDSGLVVQNITVEADHVTVALIGTGTAPAPQGLQQSFKKELDSDVAITVQVIPVEETTVTVPADSE